MLLSLAWLVLFASEPGTMEPMQLPSAARWHVFLGTGGASAEGIYRAEFDAQSGQFTPAQLAARSQSPGFLALHPGGKLLYAVDGDRAGPGVEAYAIDTSGALTRVHKQVTGDGQAAHIAVHPSAQFLLTAQYGNASVALFPLDAQGLPGSPSVHRHSGGSKVVEKRQDSAHPHWCGFSPDGRFALVPDLGLDGVVIYSVDLATPAIRRHGFVASVPGGGPRHMRFSIDGKHFYLLNELNSTVSCFAWNAEQGSAQLLQTYEALSAEAWKQESFHAAAEILVHPSGRYLYTSNRGHDSISVFRVDPSTAVLERLQLQPIRGAFPRSINLTPDGRWVLAAGADSNTLAAHRVDLETGLLSFPRRAVISVPAPICIVFVPKS